MIPVFGSPIVISTTIMDDFLRRADFSLKIDFQEMFLHTIMVNIMSTVGFMKKGGIWLKPRPIANHGIAISLGNTKALRELTYNQQMP